MFTAVSNFFAAHVSLTLIISSLLAIIAGLPFMTTPVVGSLRENAAEVWPLLGFWGVLLQRWLWWFRGTRIFALETPIFIGGVLSVSRLLALIVVRRERAAVGAPAVSHFVTIASFIFIVIGAGYQFYAHDIADPALDVLLASLLVCNLNLFALAKGREARVWAWVYHVIALSLTSAGCLSPLEASCAGALGYIPCLAQRGGQS